MMVVQVSTPTLFHVAAAYLGDARLWTAIAQANGLSDPQLRGITTLAIPSNNVANTVSG